MSFPPQFLDDVRARVGLAEVIGRRVPLRRKGRELWGLCPFHKERTPSFSVNEEKGFFHCFGCGEHGSVFDFVMRTEGLSFPEAVERLAALAGLAVPESSPEERMQSDERQSLVAVMEAATAWFERSLRMPEGRAALDYLGGRGLDDATIAGFRLGFAPDARGRLKAELAREGIDEAALIACGLVKKGEDDRPAFEYFRGRVMFPIADRRGRIVAFGGRLLGPGEPKYLNSPETALFHKGRTLYGLDRAAPAARAAGTLIVVEGYMDVIALNRAGITNVVAPLGTAFGEDQLEEVWRVAAEPVLCFDGDEAGRRAAVRAAERALPLLKAGRSLRFAMLPDGDDPDSLVRRQGVEAVARVLAAAMPLSEMLWRMETMAAPAATAEARAALQRRLDDHVRRIADPLLRKQFGHEFNNRIYALGRARGWRAPAPVQGTVVGPGAARAARNDPAAESARVLLAILLNHPHLFHDVEDEIGALGFADRDLDALRQGLIEVLSSAADAASLRDALEARGLAETVKVVFRDPLVRRHSLIGSDAAPESVRAAWAENLSSLRARVAADEHERRQQQLVEDPSEESWQRIVPFIRARLGEGE